MDKFFKKNLRDVYEQKNYQALLDFRDEYVRRIDGQNAIGDSEFETLRLTFSKEFKKQALIEFFEELEKEISQDAE